MDTIDKFANFIFASGATRMLLQRAHERGSLIEGVVLYASLVDGLCRICLVLKEQIEKNSDFINEKYIYQNEGEKNFSERKIYQMAYNKKLVSKALFDELNTLYDIRNKIIHRFLISEIEYSHLEIVCSRYEKVYKQLWKVNYDLELEQINRGIGMTVKGRKMTNKDKSEISNQIEKKIESGDERNLAKTLNCVSVEEVIEFASKNKLFEKCLCGHEKIKHLSLDILNKKSPYKLEDGLARCSVKNCSCSRYQKKK